MEKARRRLKALAARLKAKHPGAASSVLDGLDETPTILALGVPEALAKILSSTNAIENLLGTLRHISSNVQRWRGVEMAVHCAGTALMTVEKKFRRIGGHGDMPSLITALEWDPMINRLDTPPLPNALWHGHCTDARIAERGG